MLKIIGGLPLAWGILDFSSIWEYTAYIVGAIGLSLIAMGEKKWVVGHINGLN